MKKKSNKNGFGERVKKIRLKKGITQIELAKKLGVTQRGISYYENETNNPSIEIIGKIAKALNITKRVLIEDSEDNMLSDDPKPIRSLQNRLKLIAKLPTDEQKYLVKTIDMLAEKHKIK